MTATPQEPDPDAEPLEAGTATGEESGSSPIPGEKQAPAAEPDDPEWEHESPRRIEGGEPA